MSRTSLALRAPLFVLASPLIVAVSIYGEKIHPLIHD